MLASTRARTTRFAILGLLAAQDGSAYDLAKRMGIHYAYFWPRARSHVFTEVKRLAAMGFVRGRSEAHGARPRRVYRITARGRRELAAWLATPSQTFALEVEPLVRLYLSRFGDDASLDAALAHAEREASAMLDIARELLPGQLSGSPPPPPDRLRDRALLFDYLVGLARFTRAWARRSRAEVQRWHEPSDDADARALATLARLHARLR